MNNSHCMHFLPSGIKDHSMFQCRRAFVMALAALIPLFRYCNDLHATHVGTGAELVSTGGADKTENRAVVDLQIGRRTSLRLTSANLEVHRIVHLGFRRSLNAYGLHWDLPVSDPEARLDSHQAVLHLLHPHHFTSQPSCDYGSMANVSVCLLAVKCTKICCLFSLIECPKVGPVSNHSENGWPACTQCVD